MRYDVSHVGTDDGFPEFQKHRQNEEKPYERGTAITLDYLEHIRMSSDGCPNDIPSYVADRRKR